MGLFDIIGPVMVGPSSSHTAGAVRIGRFARGLLGADPASAEIGLHGSFAATGEGHGTPLALLAGLLGCDPDDERIPEAEALAQDRGMAYVFREVDLGEVHPNSVRLHLARGEEQLEVCASSVGGGRIRVWGIDGFPVDLSGDYPTLVLVYLDRPGAVAVVSSVLAHAGINLAELKVCRLQRGGQALMEVQCDEVPPLAVLEGLRCLGQFEQVRFVPAQGGA